MATRENSSTPTTKTKIARKTADSQTIDTDDVRGKVRFALKMADGAQVRNIDEFRKHFDAESVVKYFREGKLLTWLEDRYYDDEAEAVAKLSDTDRALKHKLSAIFGIESQQTVERRNRLRQYTDDESILANVERVAFDQEDLADLLDAGIQEIYLCANRFVIPLRMKNKSYVGIGNAIAVIRSKEPVDFVKLGIKFDNVSICDERGKILCTMQSITVKTAAKGRSVFVRAPIDGKLVPLNSIRDPVFAGGAMGLGVAVKNPQGKLYAPFDGEITAFFPTGHAICLKSDDGIELLIHVGADTVEMNGEGFYPKAEAGDRISCGQILLEFDPAAIRQAGHDTATPITVTNYENFSDITFVAENPAAESKQININLQNRNDYSKIDAKSDQNHNDSTKIAAESASNFNDSTKITDKPEPNRNDGAGLFGSILKFFFGS